MSTLRDKFDEMADDNARLRTLLYNTYWMLAERYERSQDDMWNELGTYESELMELEVI